MGTTPLGAGDAVLVHAGVAIGREELARAVRRGEDGAGLGFDTVTLLPGLDLAATVVHRGPMSRIVPSARALAHGIDGNGYRSAGYARELYLECPDDQEQWVTEIQEPVVRA